MFFHDQIVRGDPFIRVLSPCLRRLVWSPAGSMLRLARTGSPSHESNEKEQLEGF